jgi:cellulose synthase/poly-beta-1,6-N-acetylglucosamine synthase-like glycosyltransferase
MTTTLEHILAIVFWFSVGAILYSYFLYPALIYVLVRMRGRKPEMPLATAQRSVSLVVSCYNEQETLPAKLADITKYSYPTEKIEFLFGSDGSTDRTDEILRAAEQTGTIRAFTFAQRRGKASVVNDLVANARHDVVVFTDANTIFRPDTIANLVKRFDDPSVGAVCGKLVLLNPGEEPGRQNEHTYWEFENWLKNMESEFNTLLGATGGVYAVRRELYEALPTNRAVSDDFLTPIRIVMKGYRTVYAQEALAYEVSTPSIAKEFRRKARIGAQNYAGISEFRRLLAPSAGLTAFELWSHKIIRWFIPHMMVVAFLVPVALATVSSLFGWILVLQMLLVLAAIGGALADQAGIRIGPLGIPYYGLAMNLALFVGFWKFVFGKQRTTWDIQR